MTGNESLKVERTKQEAGSFNEHVYLPSRTLRHLETAKEPLNLKKDENLKQRYR